MGFEINGDSNIGLGWVENLNIHENLNFFNKLEFDFLCQSILVSQFNSSQLIDQLWLNWTNLVIRYYLKFVQFLLCYSYQ